MGRPSCGKIAVTPVRTATLVAVFASHDRPMPNAEPDDVGDRVQRSGLARADPDAQVAGARRCHGPLRYRLLMGILGLGISFRRAPIELLERLAFTDDDLAKAYRRAQDTEGLDGAVMLSTCHRVEVYGQVDPTTPGSSR